MSFRSLLRGSGIAIGAIATIYATALHVQPVFVGQTPVARRLTASEPWKVQAASHRWPWLRPDVDSTIRTPRFAADVNAFARDLNATGKVTPDRARALATVAVTESYLRRIPPALVLGVMLTENDELKSRAKSRVGAVGLMQVYPKHWVRALGEKFGKNVRTDSTNIRYGVFILRTFARTVNDSVDVHESWRTALLRYNGCVKGRNTPDCHRYPDVVRRQVERAAKETCGGARFEECVARPLWLAMRDDSTASGR